MRTLQQRALGSLVVQVGGDHAIEDSDWNAHLAELDRIRRQHREVRVLVFAGNATPSAAQRKRLNTLLELNKVQFRCSVVTNSLVARAVVTALNWLGTNVRAFTPTHLDAAFAFLDMSLSEIMWARTQLAGQPTQFDAPNA